MSTGKRSLLTMSTQVDRLKSLLVNLIRDHDWGSDELDMLNLRPDGNPIEQIQGLTVQVFNTTIDIMDAMTSRGLVFEKKIL